jgi:hypothetical protein
MGPAGSLLRMRTKRSDLKADPTQIGRNPLTTRDHLRGSPQYIGLIIANQTSFKADPKVRVESSLGERLTLSLEFSLTPMRSHDVSRSQTSQIYVTGMDNLSRNGI